MTVHTQQLERYLGIDQMTRIQRGMAGWYGTPIAVARVPGRVLARADGEFEGELRASRYSSLADRDMDRMQKVLRDISRRSGPKHSFTSLGDLIAEQTAGKGRYFTFQKVGPTGVANVTSSLWGLGNMPAAGANASNAPGGDAPTDATTGAWPFANPTGGDTQHFVTANLLSSVAGNTLLLYDRIFQVNKTMNSTATEAVTGVPSRYQSTTTGAADSIENNFLFVEVGGTALAATAHNWTTCTYNDQANAASTLPSLAGNSGAIVRRLDHPVMQWFAPLASGDTGIKALTQMQCDAAVATGVVNFVIGHPIVWMPVPLANLGFVIDGINSAFNLTRIFDDAALAFLEICKPSTTATTYTGTFQTVAG